MKLRKRTYLDVAAAAPVLKEARDVFTTTLMLYGNPSSMHEEGRLAKEALEEARTDIARLVACKTHNVIFTSGATEANALAVRGVLMALSTTRTKDTLHVLYHPGAHASITNVMASLQEEGYDIEPIATKEGVIDIERMLTQCKDTTVLVSLEAISPETGMMCDARAVRRALDTLPSRVFLHVDGSQVPLVESVRYTHWGADLLTLDAQKIGGVRGIGVLVRAHGVPLLPYTTGGGQEGGLRSGTESPALATAFAVALCEADKKREAFVERARAWRTRVCKEICAAIPDARILGGTMSAPHILTFAFPGRDTDYLVALLNEAGFAVSTKSACEAGATSGSRMALSETGDEALAKATLRISWGRDTHERELVHFTHALIRALEFLDQKGK